MNNDVRRVFIVILMIVGYNHFKRSVGKKLGRKLGKHSIEDLKISEYDYGSFQFQSFSFRKFQSTTIIMGFSTGLKATVLPLLIFIPFPLGDGARKERN